LAGCSGIDWFLKKKMGLNQPETNQIAGLTGLLAKTTMPVAN